VNPNFPLLVVCMLVAFALKELVIVLKNQTNGVSYICSCLNVFGCVIALLSYKEWLL